MLLSGATTKHTHSHTTRPPPTPPATTAAILPEVSLAIGTGVGANSPLPPGMIGGQVVDIESEGKQPTAELVESIHRAKTGALITTSIVSGGLYGSAHAHTTEDTITPLRTFCEQARLAFQILHDVLATT